MQLNLCLKFGFRLSFCFFIQAALDELEALIAADEMERGNKDTNNSKMELPEVPDDELPSSVPDRERENKNQSPSRKARVAEAG